MKYLCHLVVTKLCRMFWTHCKYRNSFYAVVDLSFVRNQSAKLWIHTGGIARTRTQEQAELWLPCQTVRKNKGAYHRRSHPVPFAKKKRKQITGIMVFFLLLLLCQSLWDLSTGWWVFVVSCDDDWQSWVQGYNWAEVGTTRLNWAQLFNWLNRE